MTREARWVLLLRGVNVGGVKVLSAELRQCLEAAGFADVRTVLASGNALVTAEGGEEEILERAAQALRARYARQIPLVVRSQQQVAGDVAGCPFPSDSKAHHAYLVYLADDGAARDLSWLASAALAEAGTPPEDEAIAAGDRLMYWRCPVGATLKTPVSETIVLASRRVLTTTRNVRTMARLRVN